MGNSFIHFFMSSDELEIEISIVHSRSDYSDCQHTIDSNVFVSVSISQ